MLKQQIAADLEKAFSQYGFAEPSVAQLKDACHVSLRTLYKYYASKEQMIAAALEHRHQRYIEFLLEDNQEVGTPSILAVFDKLGIWMRDFAPNGCMSSNAVAAFPENQEIREAVSRHKLNVMALLGEKSQQPQFATSLLLIHEGISNSWTVLGEQSVVTAKQLATTLLEGGAPQ
ncbi:TetR family transcriptional regulator [Vibrio panuliri]|uniref:TetR family transcriptional regulator n=1 Tax=Vibrio panuliri TaxID=1381081 RepID=A0A1Q9HQI7_9VIBR|nr:TetR/AcrR family transcriptional regulator [Vibrio panuliri]OLQ93113.1 TetR family transcriptional regulator [Vibrio panuliri]